MQREGLDNANPTILSASQLPSRGTKRSTTYRGPECQFDHILYPKGTSSLSWDSTSLRSSEGDGETEEFEEEPIDEQEIYDLISCISDPEHPHTLGQLSVVNLYDIHVTPAADGGPGGTVVVDLTPTITHCSLATVIGLAVRVRLERALPPHLRVDVRIKAGSHTQDDQVTKQLSDKERVAAALENDTLRGVIDKMMETCV